jgi:hypothetical protein
MSCYGEGQMKTKLIIFIISGIFVFIQPLSAQTWFPSKRLTWTSGNSWYPAVAVDSNTNIHVVWHDDTPGVAEVYYKRSPNGGLSWESSKRLTWNPGFSISTAIAVDANNTIHMVWYNNTSGNPEIYYKKGKQ